MFLSIAPLLFQILFAAALFSSLHDLQTSIAQEQKCQSIISAANRIYEGSLNGALRGATNVLTRTASLETIFSDYGAKVQASLERLRQLTEEDPAQRNRVNRLLELTKQVEAVGRSESADFKSGTLNDQLMLLRRYSLLRKLVDPLAQETREIVNVENIKLNSSRTGEKRKMVHALLLFGLLTDCCLCLLLAYFFGTNIAGRLSLLSQNSLNFAAGKAFGTILDGRDELALLDQSFRKMAETILAARNWKQEMLAMINHDIRLPITAAIGTVALLQKGVYGELISPAPQRLTKHVRALEKLVDLLEDLLELEKIEAGMMRCQMSDCSLDEIITNATEKVQQTVDFYTREVICEKTELIAFSDSAKLQRLVVRLLNIAGSLALKDTAVRVLVAMNGSSCSLNILYEGDPLPDKWSDSVSCGCSVDYLAAVVRLLGLKLTSGRGSKESYIRILFSEKGSVALHHED
jgi:HAMP domain-containing protein/ribosomal protein L17